MRERPSPSRGSAAGPSLSPGGRGLEEEMRAVGQRARAAAQALALASAESKERSLRFAAAELRSAAPDLLAANARDM